MKNGLRWCAKALLGQCHQAQSLRLHKHGSQHLFPARRRARDHDVWQEVRYISQLCKFAFFDWVMFCNEPIASPDNNPVLNQYLGPVINVGPALTARILKANGEAVYRSTYCELTTTKVSNAAHISRRIEFDISIMDRNGPETAPNNFPDLIICNTPKLNLFDNIDIEGRDKKWVKRWHAFTGMDEGSADGIDDKDPILSLGINVSLPNQEFWDNYVYASVMLPCGNLFAWGTVIGCKQDAHGNAVGCANNNPILDSHVYHVEFDNGDMSELTTNVIAELMYA
jgi:hypothetical protein